MAAKKSSTGRKSGRDSKSSTIRELLRAGRKPMEVAKELRCTPGLVYNVRSKMSGVVAKAGSKSSSRRTKVEGMDAILDAVKQSELDRARMRKALEQIQAVISKALL